MSGIDSALRDGSLGGRSGKHSERLPAAAQEEQINIPVGPPPGPSWCLCAPRLRGPYNIEYLDWPREKPATPGVNVMFRFGDKEAAREAARFLEATKVNK